MTNRPLKILMTDPHLAGGGQVTYLTRLAEALTGLGHEVTIGCKPGSVLIERAAQAQCAGTQEFVFRGGFRPAAWLSDLQQLRNYILTRKPDIIHVNGSQDHWVCALANRTLGRPVCIVRTRHNTYEVKSSYPNRVLNRAWTDYQIVVCDVVRRTLAQQRTFDSRRMCTIHNGVNMEQFQPDPDARARARAEFGYDDSDIVCGIAARLVEDKGHEFLFRAAAQVMPAYPELRILVLGQGVLEEKLRKMVEELGMTGIVHFAGFREDMPYCTQAFDIGVLPSIGCDTSSFSLKEEMAAEKPIIASDYGGLKEIVSDGVEGLVFPTGSVQSLASAMRRMLQDPDTRRRMGETGRKRVQREFSIEVFAERTVMAYQRALAFHHESKGRPA